MNSKYLPMMRANTAAYGWFAGRNAIDRVYLFAVIVGLLARSKIDPTYHLLRKALLVLIVCLAFLSRTVAAPPENVDTSLEPWFKSLSAPDGTACCSMADCRQTATRRAADGYEARIDDTWVAVPWDRVVARPDNPTGGAIVCYAPRTTIVLCFVPPPNS
jgi:hypothetical protein